VSACPFGLCDGGGVVVSCPEPMAGCGDHSPCQCAADDERDLFAYVERGDRFEPSTAPIDSPAGFPLEGTPASDHDPIARLLAWSADDDITPEEAAEELRSAGVDVDAFKARIAGIVTKGVAEIAATETREAPAADPVEQARAAYEAADAEFVKARARAAAAKAKAVDAYVAWKAAEKAAGGGES
jgi:hypothetical protein